MDSTLFNFGEEFDAKKDSITFYKELIIRESLPFLQRDFTTRMKLMILNN